MSTGDTTTLELLKAGALCERLGITRTTLYRWHDLGLPFVPASAAGRTKLYRWGAVVAWIEARETTRAAPEVGPVPGRKAGRPRKGAGQGGKGRWAED